MAVIGTTVALGPRPAPARAQCTLGPQAAGKAGALRVYFDFHFERARRTVRGRANPASPLRQRSDPERRRTSLRWCTGSMRTTSRSARPTRTTQPESVEPRRRRLAGLHQFAAFDHALEHDAVYRCLDACKARVEARGVETGAGDVVPPSSGPAPVLPSRLRRGAAAGTFKSRRPCRRLGRLRDRGIHFGALQLGEHLAFAHDVTDSTRTESTTPPTLNARRISSRGESTPTARVCAVTARWPPAPPAPGPVARRMRRLSSRATGAEQAAAVTTNTTIHAGFITSAPGPSRRASPMENSSSARRARYSAAPRDVSWASVCARVHR